MFKLFCKHSYDPLTEKDLEDFSTQKVRYCKKCGKEHFTLLHHTCVWKILHEFQLHEGGIKVGTAYHLQCEKCGRIREESFVARF